MKQKCKVCGNNADSDLCWRHKPKKPLKANTALKSKKEPKDVESINERNEFFLRLWNKRRHVCENCGEGLGNQPFSYFFDHTLEKSKYPELKTEEENIMFLCFNCHDKKTRGFYSEIISNRRDYLLQKYHTFD